MWGCQQDQCVNLVTYKMPHDFWSGICHASILCPVEDLDTALSFLLHQEIGTSLKRITKSVVGFSSLGLPAQSTSH